MIAEDPYKVLGVARDASEEDIRRAFRRLAKELHPDVRPNDPAASDRFRKVSAAYEIIGDADKRGRYDRGEITADGEPVRGFAHERAGGWPGGGPAGAGGPGGHPGFGDIFSDLFGGARGGMAGGGFRGQDRRYSLDVDFLEAIAGARKRVTLPDGGTLDLTVPEGVTEGQLLRLKGKGGPGLRGGEAGDALVEIHIRPHARFKRIGDDIHLEVPITIDEAVLGARIEVPTVSGRVAVNIPKGTSSGKVFRLKGKGVRSIATRSIGDQLVTVRIVLPDTIDDTLSYFLAEWRQKHAYDAGRD